MGFLAGGSYSGFVLAARAFKRIIMEIPLVLNCLHLFCD